MKILKKIIAISTLTLVILSCSKDDPQPEVKPDPVVLVPKIETVTIGTSLFIHTYDASERLLTRISSDGYKDEYSYANNTVTKKYYESNVHKSTYIYDLNADGLKIKSLHTFPSAGNYQTVYTYNANKQLATLVNSNSLDTKNIDKDFFLYS